MCVTLLVASLAVATVSTVASIDNANYQAGMAELQLNEQREQMLKEKENQRLQAQEAEIARLREYQELRDANLLALAASGVGQNMSFMQGMEVANQRALRRDLSNIRLGQLGAENRIAQQIRVNRTQLQITNANRDSAVLGSVLDGIGSALGAASFYGQTAAPLGGAGSNMRAGKIGGGTKSTGRTGTVSIAPGSWYVPGGGGLMPLG